MQQAGEIASLNANDTKLYLLDEVYGRRGNTG